MRITVPTLALLTSLTLLAACGTSPTDAGPAAPSATEGGGHGERARGRPDGWIGTYGGLGLHDLDGPHERLAPPPSAIPRLGDGQAVLVPSQGGWLHSGDSYPGCVRFTVRVLEAETERPLERAQVRFFPVKERNGSRVEPDWRKAHRIHVYPRLDGTVCVDVAEGERVALVARAPGCFPVTTILDPLSGTGRRTGLLGRGVDLSPGGSSATLWLGGGGRLRGRVLDDTGEPLPGAALLVAPPDSTSRSPTGYTHISNSDAERFMSAIFTTDRHGVFDVRGIPVPGRYAVFASRAQRATGRSADAVFLPETRECVADVALEPTADLRVLVTDDRGEPVPDPWVNMKTSWGQATGRHTTDTPVGLRIFEAVMPGRVRLLVNAPGLVGVTREIDVDGIGEQEVTIALRRGATLSGRLSDPDGAPIADVEVRFAGGGTEHTVKTDADGRYEITGLPEAKGLVQIFQPPGFRSTLRRGVSIADSPLDFTLQPLSAISGRLDPRPACGTLTYHGPGGSRTGWKRRTIEVAEDGTFLIEGIDGGRAFDLLLWPDDGACHLLRGTRLVPGKTLDVGTIDGSPSAKLRGRVVDAAGRPLAGATVYFEQFPVAQEVRTRSSADGSFTLPLNVRGPALLVVESDGLPRTHFSLAADDERTAVDLCVHPGGTVAGTLPTTDGTTRHHSYVEFREKGGPGRWVAEPEAGLGIYEIRLPAGTYTSRARVAGKWVAGAELVVTAGAKLVLSIPKR